MPDVGKISLAEATLIEDPSESSNEDEDASVCSAASTRGSNLSVNESVIAGNRDFKIIVEPKAGSRQSHSIHLVAPTIQDKEAWISDISQCLDNIHMNALYTPGMSGTSGGESTIQFQVFIITIHNICFVLSAHHAVKADPRLFKDDVDIRFSRTLNSCKLPQVRYATPERLLQRLTDLRFLSIDFLNTFLLTYRVFTDGETVLNALKKVFYDPPQEPLCECEQQSSDYLDIPYTDGRATPRRTSGASSVSGYCSEGADRDRSMSGDSSQLRYPRPPSCRRICQHQHPNPTGKLLSGVREHLEQRYNYSEQETLAYIPEATTGPIIVHGTCQQSEEEITITTTEPQDDAFLTTPKRAMGQSSSSETIIGA